jgi:hypothetical protein
MLIICIVSLVAVLGMAMCFTQAPTASGPTGRNGIAGVAAALNAPFAQAPTASGPTGRNGIAGVAAALNTPSSQIRIPPGRSQLVDLSGKVTIPSQGQVNNWKKLHFLPNQNSQR